MGAYKDLKAIMENIIGWESSLKDFYDVAEIAMRDEKSKGIIRTLRSNHVDNLQITMEIDIDSFGKNEWVKNVPEYSLRDLIPIGKIKRDSDPLEIFRFILEYEEKVKTIYALISEKILERDEKELFCSLATFKNKQIFEIRRLVAYLEYL